VKVRFELDDDEEGMFSVCQFEVSISEHVCKCICQRVSQFLYPFTPSMMLKLHALVQEEIEGHGMEDVCEALDFPLWEIENLESMKNAIDDAIEAKRSP
jgi:hypothetical protein